MIYVTGDIHGDVSRFHEYNFPEQSNLTENDCVIILGDFGVIWDQEESEREKKALDYLESKKYKILFIDGNHENFNRLYNDFEVKKFCGGKVHEIRSNVLHLMRGQIFEIDNKKLFVFGGAKSQDIRDGVLEPDDSRIELWQYNPRKYYRINNKTWWAQEMPSTKEMAEGRDNLKNCHNKVDYILTHDMPSSDLIKYSRDMFDIEYKTDKLTNYLERIKQRNEYRYWLCGHHHDDCNVNNKLKIFYTNIARLV